MATSTVTLDQAYFDTLLRRAHFHADDTELTVSSSEQTVTISKADHDSLLATARQYANLQRNLYLGGMTDESLALLTQDETTENYTTFSTAEDNATDGEFNLTESQQTIPLDRDDGHGRQRYTFRESDGYAPRGLRRGHKNTSHNHFLVDDEEDAYTRDEPSEALYDKESRNNGSTAKPSRARYDKFAKRSILLTNIHDATTLSDVVEAVRGGLLLDIYLRTNRTVSISFLEAAHASEFFQHVKRNDLYIRGKKVTIRWSDSQFILPGHIANKIANGATRNLVIRRRNPNHTEDAIREDLEHIHNLVIIKVTFNGADAHISTNSIHNAMFARTCMMSRTKYRGCRIEWDEDECAAPIETHQKPLNFNGTSKRNTTAPLMNRFELLNMDGADDYFQEDDDHNANGEAFDSALPSPAVGAVA